MKMRRHRVFLLCTVGLCVISFLHYYKALHYVSLLRELSAPYPNIKSFIMVTGFFWREKGVGSTPISPASPEEAPPLPILRQSDTKARAVAGDGGVGGLGIGGVVVGGDGIIGNAGLEVRGDNPIDERAEDHLKPRNPSHPAGPDLPENILLGKQHKDKKRMPDPLKLLGDLHTRNHQLLNDRTAFFVRTKAGAFCFRQGTEVATQKEYSGKTGGVVANGAGEGNRNAGQRKPLEVQQQPSMNPKAKTRARGNGKRLVKCVCRPGWHGPYCGVPTMVYHSNLPTKERLTPRETPRRVINAINVNHEFDLLHVRFHELSQAVDLFLVCESNFTAYGEKRPLSISVRNNNYSDDPLATTPKCLGSNFTADYDKSDMIDSVCGLGEEDCFLRLLLNGTYDYIRHKILYVFLDHFPEGGRQDGWIADDYLRTYLTHNGLSRVSGLRSDDVFVINDADEIPAREGLLFLKLFDGWTEPFAIHMRKSLYGFFWKQFGSLEVVSGCTVGMLRDVYDGDGIKLRRREYYTMPGFRKYENDTGHILVQWPEGIFFKLVSAQNGDFPRWGDYEDKRDLNYIRDLIRTGGWFDGSLQEYPPVDAKEHMYAPKYMLEHYERYRYLLENPYRKASEG
ncbi:Beta-14-mannosyl-glycoprotein 4-beta-N-acetylglucosaminyltransferase [Dissostichus eleginoides]|uniref:Beta-14-mannosyl-glycoprotein 4-beta-N-acetylglucosaminyltransferase n=1 Tax=Dissostichus eleginoides TaxID=100907 RepID=A0AAD9BMN9_DISEL|nr:Beta-14-mannosyl-glycoprotein 4-beta-N-acetylglucosaminyltransferase [Dissostichus eleginoides]